MVAGSPSGHALLCSFGKAMNRFEESEKQLTRRCPRLGGPVSFRYCRSCDRDQRACFKIIDCWWETFDVVRYLADMLPGEEMQRLLHPEPPAKIAGIIRCADKARRS